MEDKGGVCGICQRHMERGQPGCSLCAVITQPPVAARISAQNGTYLDGGGRVKPAARRGLATESPTRKGNAQDYAMPTITLRMESGFSTMRKTESGSKPIYPI